MLGWNFPCFCLCPLPLVTSLSTTGKNLYLSPLYLPFRYLYILMSSPKPSLLQAKQTRPFQPFLAQEMTQAFDHLPSPSLDSLQHIHIPLALRSPELHPAPQMWTQQCWVERKDHYSQPAGNALSKGFRNTTHLLYGKGMLLTHVQLSVRITRWTPGKQFYKVHKEV